MGQSGMKPGRRRRKVWGHALRLAATTGALLCCALFPQTQRSTADLLAEADHFKADGAYDRALAAYSSALDSARAAQDRAAQDRAAQASALHGLGDTYFQRGEYAPARKLLDQAVALREPLGDKSALAATLNSIGRVIFAQGDMLAALDYFTRSLTLRREAGDRAGVAASLNNLGNIYKGTGDYLRALDYLDESEREFAAIGNHRSRATVLNNQALCYGYIGGYERALDLSGRSLEIFRGLEDKPNMAGCLDSQANFETWRGNYRAALAGFEQALQLRQEIDAQWGTAETLNNIGTLYQAQANHQQAVSYFSRSLALNQTLGDQSLEAEGHLNLGTEFLAMGKFAAARRELDRSYTLCVATSRKPVMAEALTQLARAFVLSGNPAQALADLERAISIERDSGDRAGLSDTTVQLAATHLTLRHPQRALSLAREAAQTAASIDHPEALWQAHTVAGKALLRLSRHEEAAAEFDRAIETIETLRRRVVGPATALPAYFADKLEPYHQRMSLALESNRVVEALHYAEESKARALAEALGGGRTAVYKSMSPAERESERRLENQLAALNIQAPSQPQPADPAPLRRGIDEKRRQLEDFETALYAAHPSLAIDRGGRRPARPADFAALPRTLILDYVVTARRVWLFVVKPGAPARAYPDRKSTRLNSSHLGIS